jgi:hypothetical protein
MLWCEGSNIRSSTVYFEVGWNFSEPFDQFYQLVGLDCNPIHCTKGLVDEPPLIHTLVLHLAQVAPAVAL